MYLFPEKLKAYLKQQGWTPKRFAEELDVEVSEVNKMLNGEYIDVDSARRFIMFFKVPLVLEYIDFAKTGVESPFVK